MDIFDQVYNHILRNENLFQEHNNIVDPFIRQYEIQEEFQQQFDNFILLSYQNHHWRTREDLMRHIVEYMRLHIQNAL